MPPTNTDRAILPSRSFRRKAETVFRKSAELFRHAYSEHGTDDRLTDLADNIMLACEEMTEAIDNRIARTPTHSGN